MKQNAADLELPATDPANASARAANTGEIIFIGKKP